MPTLPDSTRRFAGKKLGVLLTTPPQHSHFLPAVALMQAALAGGIFVYLYCIDEGVWCVGTSEIKALQAQGASLFGCAYGAQHRGIATGEEAAWSGLTVLADVIGSTDRFVSF